MVSSLELVSLFFRDLKSYNATNFRTIQRAALEKEDATVHKAFSAVVTRYFIFKEHHPEVSDVDMRVLYFKLKIDMIARYFANYPCSTLEELRPFQLELQNHVNTMRGGDIHDTTDAPAVSNLELAAASGS